MPPFDLAGLDHVAINATNPERSITWYHEVLGLKRQQFEAWGDFPVFMLNGTVGVAIFKANADRIDGKDGRQARIDHFAFHITKANLDAAEHHFAKIGQPYIFKDHTYFHSVYLYDPDGHTVELTAPVVDLQKLLGE